MDWEALFQGYQATVDWPGCTFYENLMRFYPDAKVILTVRDPERWYEAHGRRSITFAMHSRAGCPCSPDGCVTSSACSIG